MSFVLDNSVVTGWSLPSQATDYSEAIAVRLETEKAIVPPLWQLELIPVSHPIHTNYLNLPCDTN